MSYLYDVKQLTGESEPDVQKIADEGVKQRESMIGKAKILRNKTVKSLGKATQFFIQETVDAFIEGYKEGMKND